MAGWVSATFIEFLCAQVFAEHRHENETLPALSLRRTRVGWKDVLLHVGVVLLVGREGQLLPLRLLVFVLTRLAFLALIVHVG